MGSDKQDKSPSQNVEEPDTSDDEKQQPNPVLVDLLNKNKKRVGRKRGVIGVTPWSFNEINTLFKLMVEECPPALNGSEFVEQVHEVLPGRTEPAIQSFISHKLSNELKTCIFLNYHNDFEGLTRRQRLYLARALDENEAKLRRRLLAFDEADEVQSASSAKKARTHGHGKDNEVFKPWATSTPISTRHVLPNTSGFQLPKSHKGSTLKKCDKWSEDNSTVRMNRKRAVYPEGEAPRKLKAKLCTITVVHIFEDGQDDSLSGLSVSKDGEEYTITPDSKNWSVRAECGHRDETRITDMVQVNDVINLCDDKFAVTKLKIKDSDKKQPTMYKTLYMKNNNGAKYPVLFSASQTD